MQHQKLFVFNIETVPDTSVVAALTGSEAKDQETLRHELTEYHLQLSAGKSDFLRPPFHQIVAISFLEAEIHQGVDGEEYILLQLRSGGKEDANEQALLEGFFGYLHHARARLVSYNGRVFNLPVLRYRAMKYGIQAGWFYNSGDKWNNYTTRYSLDWHCDLVEALSDFGAGPRCKLHEICSILNLPGKLAGNDDKVTPLYDEGKLSEVRQYCETDVLSTYLVYLRYMHHCGKISTWAYNQAIGAILAMIENAQQSKPYLCDFLIEWEASSKGKFLLE